MLQLVIDASAVLAVFMFDDAAGQDYGPIVSRVDRGGVTVPAIFTPEILHVLVKAERRTRGLNRVLEQQLAAIRALDLLVDPDTALHLESRSLPLARTHRLSIFDATYRELAMRLSLPLATFDNGLIRAAQAEQVSLLP